MDCLQMTLKAKGIIVCPNAEGLNYCTGYTCIMEALALGKPIIYIKNPYYDVDIEKEGAGISVPFNDPDKIVDAIKKVDSNDSLYELMCKNAFRLSKKYNMHVFEQELYSIIDDL